MIMAAGMAADPATLHPVLVLHAQRPLWWFPGVIRDVDQWRAFSGG
jgi:hypothetical protein